jgi:hypothetical protein
VRSAPNEDERGRDGGRNSATTAFHRRSRRGTVPGGEDAPNAENAP